MQSDWMAAKKTSDYRVALAHAFVYTIPFLFVTQSLIALSVIALTHAIIDNLRLARYIVWLKNFIAPRSEWPQSFESCKATGSSVDKPAFIAVWLMIITDNLMHVIINATAIWVTN